MQVVRLQAGDRSYPIQISLSLEDLDHKVGVGDLPVMSSTRVLIIVTLASLREVQSHSCQWPNAGGENRVTPRTAAWVPNLATSVIACILDNKGHSPL